MSADPRRHLQWKVTGGIVCCCLSGAAAARAGSIDTTRLEQPWPHERIRQLEVGHDPVRWREHASRREGIFAGVRFTTPRTRQVVWDLANDYADVGTMTPGVTSVRILEQTPTRHVIQVDVKVLWKMLRLTFEVEQEPPKAVRFRLVNQAIGEYRGLCTFAEAVAMETASASPQTIVELSTWLKPARPVPIGLILLVERMTLLRGAKQFLESCERPRVVPVPAAQHF